MKLFLLVLCLILLITCEKQLDVKSEISRGKIVGYLKCLDKEKDYKSIFGLFIIADKDDSLLSFNIPSFIYNLDTSRVKNGIGFLDGDSISFSYRDSKSDELIEFDCPPTTMENPTFYNIENFSQVIIANINKIK
jgi:hypothetical protein